MTRWPGDEELEAWMRLVAVIELLPGVLESQLKRDSDLTHFEYVVLAMLSEAPECRLRMSVLGAAANATLPRPSHVVSRLEGRGLMRRVPCPEDRRATNAELTDGGWELLVAAAPGHVEQVRTAVFDVLSPAQVGQLSQISAAVLGRLDPEGVRQAAMARR